MIERDRPPGDTSLPAHERLYRALRARVMHGLIPPGQALTLRGLAAEFGVSMTPAREAIRRLVAEGALKITPSGRVATPELTPERIEELAALRALLEPELASRALPRAHLALIDRMAAINGVIDEMIVKGDASGYVRANLEFHRTLYLRAQAPRSSAARDRLAPVRPHHADALRAPPAPAGLRQPPQDHRGPARRRRARPAPRHPHGRDAGAEDARRLERHPT
jgi:DNA-binding GntR family transcriptional regulator